MKKVLIATDGSPSAEEAAWLLSRLPHQEKLEIVTLSIFNPPKFTRRATPGDSWTDELLERERQGASEAGARIHAMFEGANVSLRHVTLQGHLGQSIISVAEAEEVDLVVLGAKGHSTVGRLLLGSTSDYVATHAPCSVLVVRPTGLRDTPRSLRAAIAYDDSDPARASLKEFCQIGWGGETDVQIVTAVPYMYGLFGEVEPDHAANQRVMEGLEFAAQEVRGAAPKVEIRAIESDHLGEGLVRFVESHACDLIVLGESPRGAVERLLMGSVSRFVLRHAPCSVWITRNRADHS